MTNGLHRLALRAEQGLERLGARPGAPPVLEPYRGYAEPNTLVLRGRVLTHLRRTAPRPDQSRWTNLRQMAGLFLTDEVAGVTIEALDGSGRAESDREGYVTLRLPRGDRRPGWRSVPVTIAGQPGERVDCPVLVPDPAARFGVISDIDDTMMQTGAYSLGRNLWTTFTGSALTRRVFPDAVAAMTQLSGGGRNPVFYVSSSPWNLHAFLNLVFERAGLVAGPMFLRDLGPAEGRLIAGSHGGHKDAMIDRILAANPGLPFVLLGDTGQKDAFVYRDAVLRHPGRIARVALREPPVGASRESLAAIAAIREAGVPCQHGPDFTDLAAAMPG